MSAIVQFPSSTRQTVQQLKDCEQDFEWYPTTDQIIQRIKLDTEGEFRYQSMSVLDCGAGDGRVLTELTPKGEKYAIEKSTLLHSKMSPNITLVGTEFREQTLIDKQVEVIFSNPPYSEFEYWATKIIREGNARYAYLVIPDRWENSQLIARALESRGACADVLGVFDFLNAERAARAKVHVVRIKYSRRTSAFDLWFDENFPAPVKATESCRSQSNLKEDVKNELVVGSSLIDSLQEFYLRDMRNLTNTFRNISNVDATLLKKLNVDVNAIKKALESEIKGLKLIYWKELFSNLDTITDRLTSRVRNGMINTMMTRTHIDFSKDNVYAVVLWVIRNANQYFDEQLISFVENLTSRETISYYKSNQRTFGEEHWRYGQTPSGLEKYGLEYRIVATRCGGVSTSEYRFERDRYNGLTELAFTFLEDMKTVATNLGFDTKEQPRIDTTHWESGVQQTLKYWDHADSCERDLCQVRAYKNGNIHLKFNQAFICKLNVEFGRLKGWLKDARQAADEMGISGEEASKAFNSTYQLGGVSQLRLGFAA
jgi:hypothetical protein